MTIEINHIKACRELLRGENDVDRVMEKPYWFFCQSFKLHKKQIVQKSAFVDKSLANTY